MDWRSHSNNNNNIARFHHEKLFLFEATGDSEGDSYLVEYPEANLQSFIWLNILGGLPLINNEDDAESCSCDSIDDQHRDLLDDSNDDSMEHEVMEVEDEEEVAAAVVAEESRNIIGGVHGSRKMMEDNHMEGDKLFWETCLEAGYP